MSTGDGFDHLWKKQRHRTYDLTAIYKSVYKLHQCPQPQNCHRQPTDFGLTAGLGEQDPQHAERDLLRQDERRRQQLTINDSGFGAETAR